MSVINLDIVKGWSKEKLKLHCKVVGCEMIVRVFKYLWEYRCMECDRVYEKMNLHNTPNRNPKYYGNFCGICSATDMFDQDKVILIPGLCWNCYGPRR